MSRTGVCDDLGSVDSDFQIKSRYIREYQSVAQLRNKPMIFLTSRFNDYTVRTRENDVSEN